MLQLAGNKITGPDDKDSGVFKDNPWPIFAFFAVMMIWQLVWVLSKVPETKGVSLEELENRLIEK